MTYQTGVSASIPDLITSLLNFAQENGFTIGPTGTFTGTAIGGLPAATVYDTYSLIKGGVYFLFFVNRTGTPYVLMNTAATFTGSSFTLAAPQWQRVDNLVGPHVGYHLFADEHAVNAAVEVATNVFVHFNFGSVRKNGNWVGGEFVTGLNQGGASIWTTQAAGVPFGAISIGSTNNQASLRGHVRCELSPTAVSLIDGSTLSSSKAYFTGLAPNCGRILLSRSPNAMNGRAVLVPINLVHGANDANGPYYQLGFVPNACFVNMRDINPKEMVNNDWMVFPMSQKNGPGSPYLNSENIGLAYKK